MNHLFRIISFCFFLVFFVTSLHSQDSALYKWKISTRKIVQGKYELVFSTDGVKGWQLYSPSQTVPDLTTTELKFGDSAISQEGGFNEHGVVEEISSPVFDNAKVKLYKGPAEWRTVINIKGVVPAELQGSFQYTYGRGEEFYPTPYDFHVLLE